MNPPIHLSIDPLIRASLIPEFFGRRLPQNRLCHPKKISDRPLQLVVLPELPTTGGKSRRLIWDFARKCPSLPQKSPTRSMSAAGFAPNLLRSALLNPGVWATIRLPSETLYPRCAPELQRAHSLLVGAEWFPFSPREKAGMRGKGSLDCCRVRLLNSVGKLAGLDGATTIAR